jgi:hypothetical protein
LRRPTLRQTSHIQQAERSLWPVADGHTIFFKIDYYDETLSVHSPDAADPAVTKRVITIMLAEEY